jgi:hypothetical protein
MQEAAREGGMVDGMGRPGLGGEQRGEVRAEGDAGEHNPHWKAQVDLGSEHSEHTTHLLIGIARQTQGRVRGVRLRAASGVRGVKIVLARISSHSS